MDLGAGRRRDAGAVAPPCQRRGIAGISPNLGSGALKIAPKRSGASSQHGEPNWYCWGLGKTPVMVGNENPRQRVPACEVELVPGTELGRVGAETREGLTAKLTVVSNRPEGLW